MTLKPKVTYITFLAIYLCVLSIFSLAVVQKVSAGGAKVLKVAEWPLQVMPLGKFDWNSQHVFPRSISSDPPNFINLSYQTAKLEQKSRPRNFSTRVNEFSHFPWPLTFIFSQTRRGLWNPLCQETTDILSFQKCIFVEKSVHANKSYHVIALGPIFNRKCLIPFEVMSKDKVIHLGYKTKVFVMGFEYCSGAEEYTKVIYFWHVGLTCIIYFFRNHRNWSVH